MVQAFANRCANFSRRQNPSCAGCRCACMAGPRTLHFSKARAQAAPEAALALGSEAPVTAFGAPAQAGRPPTAAGTKAFACSITVQYYEFSTHMLRTSTHIPLAGSGLNVVFTDSTDTESDSDSNQLVTIISRQQDRLHCERSSRPAAQGLCPLLDPHALKAFQFQSGCSIASGELRARRAA